MSGLQTGYVGPMGVGDVARLYHRETSQSPRRSPRPSVAGFVPMDPDNRPRPFKRYPQARVHALPKELPARRAPAAEALSGRTTSDTPVGLELLSRLLFFSAGITRTATADGGDPLVPGRRLGRQPSPRRDVRGRR